MKKRLISLILALVMIFTLLPISAAAASNQDRIWDYLKEKGFSDAGAAGIMGNIQQESGYRTNNLEDRYEASLEMTDAEYTAAVDNGTYSKDSFVNDHAGYGLVQWTYYTRKEALYDYVKSRSASIADLKTQLDFMYSEMSASLKSALKETTDVQDACIRFHDEYEQSADTESMKQNRVRYALAVYDAYSPKGSAPDGDDIIITNYNYPKIVEEGKSFTIYGTVISGKSDISCLTVGVYNSSGTMVTGKIVNPGMRTYGISAVDKYVKFGTLSVGTYYYRVTAINFSDSVQVLNKKFTVVKEHTHSYGTAWKTDAAKHWHECACGAESDSGVHTYGSWNTTKAVTCTADGVMERKCTVCGYKQSKIVGKTGHNYVNGVCTRCGTVDPDYKPAAPVVVISTVPSTGKPLLTWNAVNGASKYEIYRATSSGGTYTKMFTTSNTSYTNTTAAAGTTYYYKVKAICGTSSAGNSVLSDMHYITCDCAAPVVAISTVALTGKPKLTWNAVDGASKYEVYRATSKDGTYSKMFTTSNTSYTNSTAVAGKTYYYKVKAICGASSAGNSAFSDMHYITCDCAQPVVTISTVALTGKPKLTWNAVDGASKYEVYRAASKDGTYSKMFTTSNTSYTNSTAVAGKTYYYKVKAICGASSAGNSAFSDMHYITCDCAQPVVTISTVASTGKPQLTWNVVDGASKYEIYRAASKDGTYSKMYTTTGTNYTNTTAVTGITYYYKVKAICGASSAGNSAFSDVHYITCG